MVIFPGFPTSLETWTNLETKFIFQDLDKLEKVVMAAMVL
jgi:hypothetical protein